MTPDYDAAAIRATETLIKYRVSFAPIIPLPILKSMPNVLVVSFAEFASSIGIDRKNVIYLRIGQPGCRDFRYQHKRKATVFCRVQSAAPLLYASEGIGA